MAHIILTGLESPQREELGQVLSKQGHRVSLGWRGALGTADALFCNGDDPTYTALVREVRNVRPTLPLVVVTRLPESEKWLDALEAGAADYCSAPFETTQICWLLSAVLGHGELREPDLLAEWHTPGTPSAPERHSPAPRRSAPIAQLTK